MGRTDPETIKYLFETTWLLTAIGNMFYPQAFRKKKLQYMEISRRYRKAIGNIGMSEFGEYTYLCGA